MDECPIYETKHLSINAAMVILQAPETWEKLVFSPIRRDFLPPNGVGIRPQRGFVVDKSQSAEAGCLPIPLRDVYFNAIRRLGQRSKPPGRNS
jgi:hypothetical protein